MSTPTPKKLIVEFEDGSKAEASWEEVPFTLRADVLRQGFASRPSPAPKDDKFVLVEWEDGWKEVVSVPSDCEEINRYRVIVRPEEVGRLSLKRAGGYPELVEIHRRPAQVQRITFQDTFSLEQTNTLREGKKKEFHFALKKDQDSLGRLKADLESALSQGGDGAEVLAGSNREQWKDNGATISRLVGVQAGRRQQDLLDFLGTLMNGGD